MVEMESWFNDTLDKFIVDYVLGRNTHATNRIQIDTEETNATPLRLLLPNRSISSVFIPYRIKHYAHNVLQLGLLYMQFLDVCQIPDRSRLLTTLKYMMAVFKAVNSHSKYALETLRFLAHQQASYSLYTANKSCMVHIVRKLKKLVKIVGSNNIMGTISRKSRALAGMSYVTEQYEHDAGGFFHKYEKTLVPTDGSLSRQNYEAWIQHHNCFL
ncbi:hypothetical protein ACJMK2_009480 [Sinanodonta woodiana]|uniref:Uncharacterized protein n=1 Tax=Sinanodonta woodiana TaxID=1069815 RepID=A0ABD3VER1_SINWO